MGRAAISARNPAKLRRRPLAVRLHGGRGVPNLPPLAPLAGPIAAHPDPPFAPKLLPGTTLRPAGLAVKLRVPSQWSPTPSQLNGMGVLLFQVPGATGRALVFGN